MSWNVERFSLLFVIKLLCVGVLFIYNYAKLLYIHKIGYINIHVRILNLSLERILENWIKKIPEIGFEPMTSELWAPRASSAPPRLREEKMLQCLDAPLRCDDIYRRQVSILWPPAYKAITISHSDVIHDELGDRRCFRRSAAELHRCLVWFSQWHSWDLNLRHCHL